MKSLFRCWISWFFSVHRTSVMRFFGSQRLYIQLKVFYHFLSFLYHSGIYPSIIYLSFIYHLFIIYLLIAFGGIIVCCVWCMPFIVLCFCMLSLGLCVSMYIWIVYMITCTEVWVNQTCCYCLSEHRHTYDMYYYICECTNYTLHYITLHCMYMYTYTTLHTYRHTYIHKVIRSLIHKMVRTWFQQRLLEQMMKKWYQKMLL
jgi:hypothetical protein